MRIRYVMLQDPNIKRAIILSSGQRDVSGKNIFRLRMKANVQGAQHTNEQNTQGAPTQIYICIYRYIL